MTRIDCCTVDVCQASATARAIWHTSSRATIFLQNVTIPMSRFFINEPRLGDRENTKSALDTLLQDIGFEMRECFCVKSKHICLKNWIFNNFQVFSFAIDGRFQIMINCFIQSTCGQMQDSSA